MRINWNWGPISAEVQNLAADLYSLNGNGSQDSRNEPCACGTWDCTLETYTANEIAAMIR
jgi:hypothetical protein